MISRRKVSPDARVDTPRRPKCLQKSGEIQKWQHLVTKYQVTPDTEEHLILWCRLFQQIVDSDAHIQKHGVIVNSKRTGGMYANPAIAVRSQAVEQIRELEERLKSFTSNKQEELDLE